jgi:predicted amidohydrolase
MKISVAQTKAIKGDIQRNIENHKKMIDLAVHNGADVIVFPELSLTGYEPTLAKKLATDQDDHRFDNFQKISNANQITIGVGMPTKRSAGICISLIIFQPDKPRKTYLKKYLHRDEVGFFVSGENFPWMSINQVKVAYAICYEISVLEHAQKAFESGAEIFIASVAKSSKGVEIAQGRLCQIAKEYSIPVLMSNCVGKSDGVESGGKTSVWNRQGILVGQLDDTNEGIFVYNTETQELFEKSL